MPGDLPCVAVWHLAEVHEGLRQGGEPGPMAHVYRGEELTTSAALFIKAADRVPMLQRICVDDKATAVVVVDACHVRDYDAPLGRQPDDPEPRDDPKATDAVVLQYVDREVHRAWRILYELSSKGVPMNIARSWQELKLGPGTGTVLEGSIGMVFQ